ncbi:hypothetical protein BFP72_07065 [Reichenbachiella sp. 5M10]|uniref:tetratricopeptide repeat protein n=1 Tax=Reichenbachiella sp. 5M10 TaxID=1889772 RepID=UPI000C160BA5|nr:tetratricopeptide repeat protein [Reichenbachiella sp. 5M10]PIB35172.1 hypothetical protein BFP72_07065 [Reichenbachiella sp. 5M10]
MKNILWVVLAAVSMLACETEDRTKGDSLYASKEYKSAVKAYDEYLELHPTHVKSLYNRGRSYEELKEYDKALADFNQVLELDKKNTSAMLSLSKYYYRAEKFDQSLFYAESAIKVKDDMAEGFFWVARASHHMGDFPKAKAAYNNAINLNKQYGEAYLYRGALKMQEDKKTGACQDFKQAKNLGIKEAEAAIKKYCN